MNRMFHCISAALLALSPNTSILGQDQLESSDELALRNARSALRQLEQSRVKLDPNAVVETSRWIDLGNATLEAFSKSLPTALARYEELLRGEQGILRSQAGRYYSDKPEVVETILRLIDDSRFQALQSSASAEDASQNSIALIFHGAEERQQRIDHVKTALARLQEMKGALFDPKNSEHPKLIAEHAQWASRAFELVDSRNALLQGYLDAVPADAKLDGLPTLGEVVNLTAAQRLAEREQRFSQAKLEGQKVAEEEMVQAMAESAKVLHAKELDLLVRDMEARWGKKLIELEDQYKSKIAELEVAHAALKQKLAAARQ